MSNQITISIVQIKEDLNNGYTRLPSSTNYNQEIGSISEKYGLTEKEVLAIFKHPSLKGLKTKKQNDREIILTDANGDVVENQVEQVVELVATGTSGNLTAQTVQVFSSMNDAENNSISAEVAIENSTSRLQELRNGALSSNPSNSSLLSGTNDDGNTTATMAATATITNDTDLEEVTESFDDEDSEEWDGDF